MRLSDGLRLGAIAGIDIFVDASLVIIFALITLSLATGIFPDWHPEWSPGVTWLTALAAAVLFFASVLIHELSHALVGRIYHVRIRRITLFIFGGMAQMEGEPPSWRAELSMAFVGPITSLVLGFAFLWLLELTNGPLNAASDDASAVLGAMGPVASLLLWLGPVNITVGLFNLVPGFPLDGGRVLRALMWGLTDNLQLATRLASNAGQVFAWLLMSIGFLMVFGLRLPILGEGLVDGLWVTFIGWYLNNAAVMSYQQLLLHDALVHIPVRNLMQTHFVRVDPNITVSRLVDEYVMASGQRSFPVETQGRLVGMVSLRDVRKHSSADWSTTFVRDIMTPAEKLTVIPPDQDAMEALGLLGRRDVGQLPVVRDHELLGLLRRDDILTWLSLHTRGGAPRIDRDVPGNAAHHTQS